MKKVLFFSVLLVMILSGCASEGEPNSGQQAAQSGDVQEGQESQATQDKQTEQILLDDDCVKVSFVEVFEEESVDGVFYFRLKVENKTEKTVGISLIDPSVNEVSTLALSGLPMAIQPNGKSLTPFFFSYSNLDISSIAELKEISFRVRVEDNNGFKEIETSDFVSVGF